MISNGLSIEESFEWHDDIKDLGSKYKHKQLSSNFDWQDKMHENQKVTKKMYHTDWCNIKQGVESHYRNKKDKEYSIKNN